MARFNRAAAPYYDDYDSSKQYTHLLAIPGRVAQAREITQIQSTVKDIIKSVGDSVLKDGNIIEGCQIIVNSSKTKATVTAGKIYINGMVLPVKETTVDITGTGTEVIGVSLNETLITETSDSSLKDPAQGYDNYNQPGCYRVKSEVVVTTTNPDTILNTLIDGEIIVERYAPEYDTLTQTLARRTYDESGSYIVEGLDVRTEVFDSNNYNVVVESGKAYVLGYELKIPTARRVKSGKSLTYSPVTYKRTYSSSTTDYQLYNAPYVKDITSVVGIKQVTENQSISVNTDRRQLTQSNVLRIVSVASGSTTYTVGGSSSEGDCYLEQQGNTFYIKWNGTESYPTQTYEVVYEYEKTYVKGTDYELVLSNRAHYLRWKSGGDTPENNTIFTVIFDQFLARKDIVYIDRYGSIDIIEGVPAEYNHEVAPEAPLNTLTLAIISNPPNGSPTATASSDKIQVNNIGLTRFTMNDIQNLLNRLITLEYDQAVLSLNDEARNDVVSNKKGIFADPLIDISRIDFQFNKSSAGAVIDASKPVFDMALDLNTNIAYLPILTYTNSVSYQSTSTSHLYEKVLTLGTTGENVVLSQMNATKSFLINPYSMFPQLPEVSVTPSVDNWFEDTIIEVPVSLTDSSVVSLSSRTVDNTYTGIYSSWYTTRSTTSVSDTAIGTRTSTYSSDSTLSQQSITYIRRRTLTVEGYDFPSNLDNIKCYFDGVEVALTPASGTTAGTLTGTVKSNDNGYLKATFMIPEKVLTGTREVKLKSDIPREGYYTEGFTLYTAQGSIRTVQRTVTTLTTILLQRTTTTTLSSVYVDPVGQTFVLDRMTILKGIDLYFESKSSVNTPVICEIREVNNGTITSQVYAHASLKPSQVTVSTDSSSATRFNFEDPVLLEENKEYAFVVRSTSDAYTLWVAELGGTDVLSGNMVLKNAYMSGVMMSSSNNSTWTAHQTTDIKFKLIEDTYAMNSVAQFDALSVDDFSRIYLAADSAIPEGTSIAWSYSLDGTNYSPITPYNIVNMSVLEDSITLRATLSRNESSRLTPMISLDSIGLTTSCYDTSGAYVSKNITNLEAYSNVKIIADVYEPAGTEIAFKFSKDDGTTVSTTTRSSSQSELNYNWKECTFTATVTGSPTQFRVFAVASSTSKAVTPAFRRLRVILS